MQVLTPGNVAHLVTVLLAMVILGVLAAIHAISGDTCVGGLVGLVVGATPAGVGVVKRERANGNGKG